MKNKNIILVIGIIIILFAIFIFSKIANKNLPAPYNQFNYFYTTWTSNLSAGYENQTEVLKTPSYYNFIDFLSDTSGFYEGENQGTEPISCGSGTLDAQENETTTPAGNTECISVNGNQYLTVNAPSYITNTNVIYQQCEKVKFYSFDGAGVAMAGRNGCEEYDLKFNNKVIDTSVEYVAKAINFNNLFQPQYTGTTYLSPASDFSYINVNGNFSDLSQVR